MPTEENLKAAFAGESQANRSYLAFAKKADREGLPQIAKLFRAAAEAETVHAHAHLRALGGIGDTRANLKSAVEGEAHEYTEMYPGFVEEAEREGHRAALVSFRNALAVEKVHHGLYEKALAAVEKGEDLPAATLYVCAVCGHTVEGEAPDPCPVCGAPKAKFSEVA